MSSSYRRRRYNLWNATDRRNFKKKNRKERSKNSSKVSTHINGLNSLQKHGAYHSLLRESHATGQASYRKVAYGWSRSKLYWSKQAYLVSSHGNSQFKQFNTQYSDWCVEQRIQKKRLRAILPVIPWRHLLRNRHSRIVKFTICLNESVKRFQNLSTKAYVTPFSCWSSFVHSIRNRHLHYISITSQYHQFNKLKILTYNTLFTCIHAADDRSICKQLNVNKDWPISVHRLRNKLQRNRAGSNFRLLLRNLLQILQQGMTHMQLL